MSQYKYQHHNYIRTIEAESAKQASNIGKDQEKVEVCFKCNCAGATFLIIEKRINNA